MVLWGLHHFDYPFLRPVAWFAPWGFLIGASLGLLAAVAIIMAYMERLQAELARGERRFRVLFHGNKVPFLLIDPMDGRIVEANDGAAAFYGYEGGELRTMNVSQINTLPPEEIATLRRRAVEGGQQQFLFKHRLKSGEVRTVEVFANPVDISGHTYLFSIVQDVTTRQQALKALQESRERLQAVVENVADAIYLADEEGRFVEVNAAAVRQTGFSRRELLGMGIHDLDASDPPSDLSAFHELLASQPAITFESRHRRADGRLLPVEVRAVRLELGGRPHLLGVVTDLTPRKEAEHSLALANKTLAAILDGIPAYVNVIDAESREVLFMNRALKDSLGVETAGGLCFRVFRGREHACENCSLDRLTPLAGDALNVWEDRNPMTGKWLINHDRILDWFDGRRVRVQVALDISQRKEAEEMMAASLLEKEVLLREIHHRVKNNLQIISSLLSLQESGQDNPGAGQVLSDCRGRVMSMALIHERLYRSRDFTAISLEDYLRDFLPGLVETCRGGRDLRMEIDARGASLGLDQAIPFGLIVNELVTNALKHAFVGRSSGRITVSAAQADGRLTLRVADDGAGLPEGFSPGSTSTLGMQIVTMLAEQLHGELSYASGQGASFTLEFPCGGDFGAARRPERT
ncbi:PAS domain S-box protein [Fundidesulfovibrio magnetotacticus]|nr:PAS domain S-box protein [Fundidesulfovibrio magnetotacticus]